MPAQVGRYDIRKLSMAQFFRGFTLRLPEVAFKKFVPNV
jgi:hypothetical protein